MGKRIHKREGSVAWGKAMQKSASRMARDLMKIPGGQELKRTKARVSYLKNKTVEEKKILEKLIAEAKERRMDRLDDIRNMHKEFDQKDNEMRRRLNLLITEFRKNRDIDVAKRIRNCLQMLLNEGINYSSQLEWLEKNSPKTEAAKIKRERQKREHECIAFIKKIKKIAAIIDEES